jgi:hypothetical protein
MRSKTCAKTVCSEVFEIFTMTLVSNQVPDPSNTGYQILEYRLYVLYRIDDMDEPG